MSPLESFISFHEHLLSFFESFLMVYHVPLFSLVYPVLWKLEPMVSVGLNACREAVRRKGKERYLTIATTF